MGGQKEGPKPKGQEKIGFMFGPTHEDLPDALQLLSLLLGSAAMIMKYRFLSWLALINAVVCIANMRTIDIDIKTIMSSFGIAIMALVFAYIGPTSGQFV